MAESAKTTDELAIFASEQIDVSVMQTLEASLEVMIQTGDTDGLRKLAERAAGERTPFAGRDTQLWRIYFIELLTIARKACIAGGSGLSWSYSLYYTAVNSLAMTRTKAEIRQLLLSTLLTFAASSGRNARYRSTGYSPVVNACIGRIIDHMPGRISLEKIAGEMHLSAKYLSAVFKKETGMTMTQFVMELRIEDAQKMLSYTDTSYSDIADTLGFCSQSHFTSIFRRMTGTTPKAFRLQSRRI